MSDTFEVHGYTIDMYVHNKLKGNYVLEKPDRTIFGYGGRTTHFLEADVVLSNKRIIKAGTKVMSECSPICGRVKVKLNWKTDATQYTNNALLELLKSNEQFNELVAKSGETQERWKSITNFIDGKLKLEITNEQRNYVRTYLTINPAR